MVELKKDAFQETMLAIDAVKRLNEMIAMSGPTLRVGGDIVELLGDRVGENAMDWVGPDS